MSHTTAGPDWSLVKAADRAIAKRYIGKRMEQPDLIIAPDGQPYLYRWWIVRALDACVYFHLQVQDDPERPLHDHPWDNMSVILAGGYFEALQRNPPMGITTSHLRLPGEVIFRRAEEAHRLMLPKDHLGYTMSQFTTGPERRPWGFYYPTGWVDSRTLVHKAGSVSLHTEGSDTRRAK